MKIFNKSAKVALLKTTNVKPQQKLDSAIKSHLDFLIQSSSDSITGTNLKREIVMWNPAAEKLYGYKEKEVLGKSIDLIVPPFKNVEIKNLFVRMAKGGELNNFITQRMRKNGSLVDVSITISPIKDAKGEIIGFSTITRDITVQKELEKKLRLFAEAVEAAPDGIQIIDLDGKIIFSNKSIEKIHGFSQKELEGKLVSELSTTPELTNTIVMRALKKYGQWGGELVVKNKNGSTFPIWLTTSIIKHDKKPIAIVAVVRDITERKKLENLKAEFLSTAAHELRTPLTTLKLLGEAHLHKFKKFGKDQVKLSDIKLLNMELDKLNLLINDLLDESRIESGRLSMNFQTVSLNKIVTDVIKKEEIIWKHHKINFKKSPKVDVVADPFRIEQVTINLISNACKYSPIFSKVDVWLDKKNNHTVEVCIKDEGDGIPMDKIDRIFDRFYQVKEHSRKGFGLGLYIAKEIVSAHKGKIWADSTFGKESTFHFTLRTI